MIPSRTQVGIVGAGPAGLMLGHLLHLHGVDSVIIEDRSRDHVIERVRAGVLEQGTVDLMHEVGVGERLQREGMRHEGIYIAFADSRLRQGAGGQGRERDQVRHRIDMAGLTGGRAITVYGQNEVVKDLMAARDATRRPIQFEAEDVRVYDLATDRPKIRFEIEGRVREVVCDFIAGCDGSHGVCRPSIPPDRVTVYQRMYPFAWLGILAKASPTSHELVYSLHERGFALFSMRSHEVTRLYLQCAPDDLVDAWPDDRIWAELRTRLRTADGWEPNQGEITQKAITPMRSMVVEPMRYGRLFLAGDAAHIVPPTGAKGLNLAMADVWRLSNAFAAFYRKRSDGAPLEEYSDRGVRRTWRAQRFSWWMTAMLHRSDSDNPFDHRRQVAELDYLVSSQAAMTSLAENYVGVPLD